ncbi:MAG: MFS transporter [Gammaproteobacteria bacterium]|jgi:MFS family permease|nr:MFS transporter [Gammaproteobacteria bacterium]
MSQYKKLLSFAIIAASALLAINFGFRSSLGLFLKPVSESFGYGREIFAFSLALQNLFWGLFQPLAGAIADKYGTAKVIILGSILYALGLYITATADGFIDLHLGAGILIGMGIAGTGLGVILPAMARMVRPEKRAFALGIGTAAGSAGQFLLIPVAREFLVAYGWQMALVIMAIGSLSMILFTPVFKGDKKTDTKTDDESEQNLREALREASKHFHYWLLIAGFFVCGFQLAFITVHMPSYLADKGFDSSVAATSLSIIGLCNIVGSLTAGHLSGIYSKKWILAFIYGARSIVIVLFLVFPISLFSVYAFSFATGFLWLATVPPTSGLVAQMFGLKYMGTLYGIVFLNHQIGSFTGVWLGGYLFDITGSYNQVWWWAAIIAAITAIIHVFIDERPVDRLRHTAKVI